MYTPPRAVQPIPPTTANRHPYAAASQQDMWEFDSPGSAPLPSGVTSSPFQQAQASHSRKPYMGFVSPRGLKRSKNSASTPNLKWNSKSDAKEPKPSKSSGRIERWLSPHTWCDALLVPRPRLRMQNDEDSSGRGNTRAMSPAMMLGSTAGQALPSRILVHSRSAQVGDPYVTAGLSKQGVYVLASSPKYQEPVSLDEKRASRPISFSWDDMALPTPVASLSK
jgi:serine/arginine repetitive matrix protein 2